MGRVKRNAPETAPKAAPDTAETAPKAAPDTTETAPEQPAPGEPLSPPGGPGYWLERAPHVAHPPLRGHATADVAIVGAGFTGLWTAIRLHETDPSLRIVVLEAEVVGYGASGRNGGFCEASLTHGLANGLRHYPDEIALLESEGVRNLRELVAFTKAQGIDCDLEETGMLTVADRPHQVDEFRAWADEAAEHGEELAFLDREAVQAEVHSPLWHAGLLGSADRTVLVDPAKLCRGLARVATDWGVAIHERSRAIAIERIGGGAVVRTADGGSVRAGHVVVATSAYTGRDGFLGRLRHLYVPVYDYALVSEPLTDEQRNAIGWRRRQGMADANNQFHYFRQTADGRILWGGYDAVHYRGDGVGPRFDTNEETFARLREQFFAAFPQLDGLKFPYRWGGPIDTTSRFTVTFGQAIGGRVTYALGYTGLGVGASRWAAGIVRDFVLRPDSELLRTRFVRSRPVPFPPEPLRSLTVDVVRHELARADRKEGRRGLLLRTLDALGIGFDS